MAVALRCAGQSAFRVLRACCSVTGRNFILPFHKQDKEAGFRGIRHESSQSIRVPPRYYVPETSLSRPPWPDLSVIDPVEGEKQQLAVISKVNNILATEKYGRLFAVVHFASRQWKVTNEDLILIENHIDAECGERIRLEKVLLVGSADFTLFGRPLLGRNLVSVEATVIEKTKSWPMVHMRFWKRHRYQRKRMFPNPVLGEPQTVHIFAPSQLPANQEHQIPGTGALGAGREQKRGLSAVPRGLGWETLCYVIVQPQTVLRINTIRVAPDLA